MEVAAPANDYMERIIKAAREFHFPEWYIEQLESFRLKGR